MVAKSTTDLAWLKPGGGADGAEDVADVPGPQEERPPLK